MHKEQRAFRKKYTRMCDRYIMHLIRKKKSKKCTLKLRI